MIAVTNASGTPLASDSFAYQISLKYRGYVYDNETGLYYLQSRYYDPETGRFLNADDVGFIGYSGEQLSYNAFAYCENNAVNRYDDSGYLTSYIHYNINYIIYLSNRRQLVNKLIHGQGVCAAKNMLYGLGKISWNGCELIAIYNALILHGVYVPLPKIIYEAEKNYGMWLKGAFGTEPDYPYFYFKNKILSGKSFATKRYRLSKTIDAERKNGDIFIVVMQYSNVKIHTVTVKSMSKNLIYVYNLYSKGTEVKKYSSVYDLVSQNALYMIVGYKVYTK